MVGAFGDSLKIHYLHNGQKQSLGGETTQLITTVEGKNPGPLDTKTIPFFDRVSYTTGGAGFASSTIQLPIHVR